MLDPNSSHERRLFRTGERVTFGDGPGIIIAAFPDGFHLIRLDSTGQISGAHASQMTSMDDDLKQRGRSRVQERIGRKGRRA